MIKRTSTATKTKDYLGNKGLGKDGHTVILEQFQQQYSTLVFRRWDHSFTDLDLEWNLSSDPRISYLFGSGDSSCLSKAHSRNGKRSLSFLSTALSMTKHHSCNTTRIPSLLAASGSLNLRRGWRLIQFQRVRRPFFSERRLPFLRPSTNRTISQDTVPSIASSKEYLCTLGCQFHKAFTYREGTGANTSLKGIIRPAICKPSMKMLFRVLSITDMTTFRDHACFYIDLPGSASFSFSPPALYRPSDHGSQHSKQYTSAGIQFPGALRVSNGTFLAIMLELLLISTATSTVSYWIFYWDFLHMLL